MNGPIAIINAAIYTPEGIIPRGLALVDGGRIVAVGESAGISLPPAARLIDAEGGRLTPGLIDLAQFDFTAAPAAAAGVTGYLRARVLRREGDLAALATTPAASPSPAAQLLGLHLIGPWLRRGAAPAWEDVWIAADAAVAMLALDPAHCPAATLAAARAADVRLLLVVDAAADAIPHLAAGPAAVRLRHVAGDADGADAGLYALVTVSDPPEQMAALWRRFGPRRLLLSGSSRRPLQARDVRRFMAHTGASFSEALACATQNPAAWLGLPLGRLSADAPAHLLCWTRYGDVAWTMPPPVGE